MPQNPYEAPVPVFDAQLVEDASTVPTHLRSVTIWQKLVCACLVLNLFVVFAGRRAWTYDLATFLTLGNLVVTFASGACTLLLATKVFHVGWVVAIGMSSFIPCGGLVALLVVMAKAIRLLQANGHDLGLFGADLSKFSG